MANQAIKKDKNLSIKEFSIKLGCGQLFFALIPKKELNLTLPIPILIKRTK